MTELDCRGKRGTNSGYRRHMTARTLARRAGLPEPQTCTECKAARAAWQRGYETRRYLARGRVTVPAVGTQRRLKALAVMGWDFVEVGKRLGKGGDAVSKVARLSTWVRPEMAEKVKALYDELSMLRGPSLGAATWARAKGWNPPLAWDEETIDDPRARPQGVVKA